MLKLYILLVQLNRGWLDLTLEENLLLVRCLFSLPRPTGSRSTFEFPSRVNLSGPSLYCIAQTLGK